MNLRVMSCLRSSEVVRDEPGDEPFANYQWGEGGIKNHQKIACTEKGRERIVCNKILEEKNCLHKISQREFQHNNQEF